MTVYRADRNKIKISLTDNEVLAFFGTYERINDMNAGTRLTVALLLREGLSDYPDEFDGDILVEIRARESAGCTITVSPAEKKRKSGKFYLCFDFSDSSSMIDGISKNSRRKQSLPYFRNLQTYYFLPIGKGPVFYE